MFSSHVPTWAWIVLASVLALGIAIDLTAHRGDRQDSRRHAVAWSLIWIVVSLGFAGFVGVRFGRAAGEQFVAAYLLEKSLSLDTLFLFLVIFGTLRIPVAEQHRVLTFGIIGALASRCVFVIAGASAVQHWHELTYAFAAFLLVTAVRLLRSSEPHDAPPRALVWLERHLPWTPHLAGHRFVTRVDGRRVATPLLVALLAIEATDVVFALDSIPAALAVTDDAFILYGSNVFAVLGLRAMYIVLARSLAGLRYLRYGLAGVLALAGAKMLVARWIVIPPGLSVAMIVTIIGASVIASVIARRHGADPDPVS